jgi:hypothetical protein
LSRRVPSLLVHRADHANVCTFGCRTLVHDRLRVEVSVATSGGTATPSARYSSEIRSPYVILRWVHLRIAAVHGTPARSGPTGRSTRKCRDRKTCDGTILAWRDWTGGCCRRPQRVGWMPMVHPAMSKDREWALSVDSRIPNGLEWLKLSKECPGRSSR